MNFIIVITRQLNFIKNMNNINNMYQLSDVQIDSSNTVPNISTGNALKEYKKITDIYTNSRYLITANGCINLFIYVSILAVVALADLPSEQNTILLIIVITLSSYTIYIQIYNLILGRRMNRILWSDFAPSNLINTNNFDMTGINSIYTEYKNKDDDVSYKILLYMFDINTITIQPPSSNLCHIILTILFPMKIPKFNSKTYTLGENTYFYLN